MYSTVQLGSMVSPGASAKEFQEKPKVKVFKPRLSRIRSPLNSNWKRDISSLWGGLNHLRRFWNRSISPFGNVACAMLDVQKKYPFNKSCNQQYMEPATSITQRAWMWKASFPEILGQIMNWLESRHFWALPERWLVPKKHHHVTSYEKMKESMPYLLMVLSAW